MLASDAVRAARSAGSRDAASLSYAFRVLASTEARARSARAATSGVVVAGVGGVTPLGTVAGVDGGTSAGVTVTGLVVVAGVVVVEPPPPPPPVSGTGVTGTDVVSMTMALPTEMDPVCPGWARVRVASKPSAFWMVPPLASRAVVEA